MSAADKLRDLHAIAEDAEFAEDMFPVHRALKDALPDIIAVIAAAERASEVCFNSTRMLAAPIDGCNCDGCHTARALAALNARLTDTRGSKDEDEAEELLRVWQAVQDLERGGGAA